MPATLAAEVELFADLLKGMAFFDGSESGGGEDPATDLIDALEIHLAEGFVALPGFEVVDGSEGREWDFCQFSRQKGCTVTRTMLLDACGAVIGFANVDAACCVLQCVDARGGALLLDRGGIGLAQSPPGQPSAVWTRLGVAGADKVAGAAAAEAETLGLFWVL